MSGSTADRGLYSLTTRGVNVPGNTEQTAQGLELAAELYRWAGSTSVWTQVRKAALIKRKQQLPCGLEPPGISKTLRCKILPRLISHFFKYFFKHFI